MFDANTHRLERPLIANVSLAYKPQVHSFQPLVTNAGIEFLTVAFPLTKYPGHLQVGCVCRDVRLLLVSVARMLHV